MDKNSILLVGSGKTGNIFVNDMLNWDKRYAGLMINSALGDMENLPNFKLCQNYVIPGVDGTGRNRDIGKNYIKLRGQSIIDIIAKYKQSKVAVFFCSADGGTGSGSTPLLIRALKKPLPDKKIILVAVMPKLSENKDSLNNAIEFWNDVIDLKKKKLVDSIILVDNNKRRTFEQINKEATQLIDKSFSLNTFDIDGNIDQNDSMKVNTASGYNFIMELENKYVNLGDAIDQAIKDSVFMLPSTYDCDYMGAVLSNGGYSIDELKGKFEVFNVDYCGRSKSENLIVLSGLALPKDGIELIQMALLDLEKRINDRKKEDIDDLYVDIEKPSNIENNVTEDSKKISSTSLSSSQINDILDDSFWDD